MFAVSPRNLPGNYFLVKPKHSHERKIIQCRQVQQQSPVAVNVNGIPSPEPGSAVVTQEMGPQVSCYQRICGIINIDSFSNILKLVRIMEIGPIF